MRSLWAAGGWAKTEKADIFIAVSESDNLNLMTAQTAKRILGVRKVMARVFDPEKEALFEYSSALGTVGLSVGVTSADAPGAVRWVETAGMLLGRLEFFVLFTALGALGRRWVRR